MIVSWIVTCDKCEKWVNARETEYYHHDYQGDFCEKCFSCLSDDEALFFDKRGAESYDN